MKNNSSLVCFVDRAHSLLLMPVLLVLFLGPLLNAQPRPSQAPMRGFAPKWSTGMTWLIETRYKLSQVRAEPVPTAILQWRFEVTEETSEAFTIVARCDEQNAWTKFEVDKKTMSVVAAEFHSTPLDKEQVMRAKYSGKGMVPHIVSVGAAPIQMPLFPVGVEPETRYRRDLFAGEHTHELLVIQQVEETMDRNRVREFLYERLGRSAMVPDSRRYFIVRSKEGSWEVEQVWAEDLPWFLYSRTPASTSAWFAR